MKKFNSIPKIIISLILAFGLLGYTIYKTGLFFITNKTGTTFDYVYYIMAIAGCVFIAFAGGVKVNPGKKMSYVLGIIMYVTAILNAMSISVLFSGGFGSDIYIYSVNIAFYALTAAIALLLSGNMTVSAMAPVIVSFIFNAVSFIIYCFRGTSLTPTDVYGFKTAMNVAGMYRFKMKHEMITATIVTIAQIMLIYKFPLRLKFRLRHLILRVAGAAAGIGAFLYISNVNLAMYDVSVFDQHVANFNYGSAFSFFANTAKMGLKKSDTYDTKKLEYMLKDYDDEKETVIPEDRPNIIVVMNESFSDLSRLGDFKTNEPYLSYFYSLKNNTIRGDLLVSVFGGYTCNTEYEFLTGMNTGLLAPNALPYSQMIFNNIPYSMVTHMKALGYNTMAFHPYYKNGWNRTNVYNFMGFDEFVSFENMKKYSAHPERLRAYVSDKGNYGTIMNYLHEKKDQSSRDFIFNITMQNHGGYVYEDFDNIIQIEDMKGSYPQTEQYLSCIKYSDDALGYFLNELRQYDEPTIVVLFGDHLPNVEPAFYEELMGKSAEDLTAEENAEKYTVPFIIWANYDIKSEKGIKTSPSFLSNKLMEVAGLPKSRVQLYLDEVQEEIPQFNPLGYYDAEGVWHTGAQQYEGFDEYYDLQYAILKNEPLPYDFTYTEDSKEEDAE